MKWVFYFLNIFCCAILYTSKTVAQTFKLKAHYNIRSSPNFLSTSNVVGVLSSGSIIQVLEKKRLPSGAYGLRIEIISSTSQSRKISSAQKWIYKANEAHFADISISTILHAKKAETEAEHQQSCINCLAIPSPMPAPQNQQDLGSITKSVEKSFNEIQSSGLPTEILRQQVLNYSQSAEVKASMNFAIKNAFESRGKCYKAVKLALTASPTKRGQGLIPARFDDEAALNAQFTLKDKYGFINLISVPPFNLEFQKPDDAPIGSVLVYSSGKKCRRSKIPDCGHVEIKTTKGYVSDFYSETPMSDDPEYKLVGVMIKPMTNGM